MPLPPPFYPFDPVWNGVAIPCEHWHFHRRLHERYGIVLRPGEYSRLYEKAVVKKQKVFYRTGRGRIHRIYLHGAQDTIFVLADDHSLISVLTYDDATKQRERFQRRGLWPSQKPASVPTKPMGKAKRAGRRDRKMAYAEGDQGDFWW